MLKEYGGRFVCLGYLCYFCCVNNFNAYVNEKYYIVVICVSMAVELWSE